MIRYRFLGASPLPFHGPHRQSLHDKALQEDEQQEHRNSGDDCRGHQRKSGLAPGCPLHIWRSYALSGLRLKVRDAVALRAFGILQAQAQIFEVARDLLLRTADVSRFDGCQNCAMVRNISLGVS